MTVSPDLKPAIDALNKAALDTAVLFETKVAVLDSLGGEADVKLDRAALHATAMLLRAYPRMLTLTVETIATQVKTIDQSSETLRSCTATFKMLQDASLLTLVSFWIANRIKKRPARFRTGR